MGGTQAFVELRPLLFGVAYRMLGSATEAEDVVQECYLRWRRVPDEDVGSPRAFLTAVVTRLCIDHLRSARVRRVTYVGPWLPEPLVTEAMPDADERAELAESVTMAFLVLLESLTPLERAAFLLREVFGSPYPEVAGILGRSEEACRQLVARARRAVGERRRRFEADRERGRELAERFLAACASGDTAGLIELLTEGVVLVSDGGGRVSTARRPVVGREHVARFLMGLTRRGPARGVTVRVTEVNRDPGAIVSAGGAPVAVIVLEPEGARIGAVRIVLNPEKLRALAEGRGDDRPGRPRA